MWSKRGRLNYRSVIGNIYLKSAVIFTTPKTLSKSTALLLIETPHKPSSPILLQYVVKRQVTGYGFLIQNDLYTLGNAVFSAKPFGVSCCSSCNLMI